MTALTPNQAHAELLETLGNESSARWIEFMQAVTRLLPDVLSVGRPSAEAVRSSLIGELGFTSWADMIEAPAEQGGLGWNLSAWKAWRRAWAVIQEHPWLQQAGLSSSEIEYPVLFQIFRNGYSVDEFFYNNYRVSVIYHMINLRHSGSRDRKSVV